MTTDQSKLEAINQALRAQRQLVRQLDDQQASLERQLQGLTGDSAGWAADTDPALGHVLEAFHALLGSLTESLSQGDAAQLLARCAAELLPDTTGAIFVDQAGVEPANRAIAAWRGAELLTDPNALHYECTEDQAAHRLNIEAQGLYLGVVELRPLSPGRALRAREQQTLQMLASAAGLALATHTLRYRLRHRNVRDPLTGLFNRRYAEDTLERELHRAQRHQLPLSVVLIDLDRFEAYNQRHGQNAGDRMLQAMSDLLQHSFRGSDICARAAGQRFLLVLPEAAIRDAIERANDLRRELAKVRVHLRGLHLPAMTVSMGVAGYPEHADSSDDLMAAADAALQLAKHSGGNTCALAEKVPLSPHNE
ncbi:GGDEF domain-containing protein [Alkalilimnicola ehrlichii MLHE-1]|uniref:diguanylate cyclase n=1 Tax=Alkalilimnicola ehrlichii (strain ATCC BAA-1101 / DSM 17681 / MLHE-1) TaxID=187272 RepID=Q0A9G8_ALKEH|nr:GGDEF domain-containing protein [Alkalilimnicola ehrlichii]ABI56519.1 diguanylate cyclase [Alkalilimnicola ehrlichii MLHE-1]